MSEKAQGKSRGGQAEGEARTGKEMLERNFDRYLQRQLHQLFDPVLGERVPDEIMRLLDAFADHPDESTAADEKGD